MTLISPASDGGEVGKRFRLEDVDRTDNATTEMELTITEFTPNERLGFEIDSVSDPVNGFSEAAEYRLTSEGARTRLTFDAHTTYRGKLPRALEPLITPATRRKAQQDLARLKLIVEEAPAAATDARQRTLCEAFDDSRGAHSAADAHRHQSVAFAAPLQLAQN